MMEVTQSNFEKVYEEISTLINSASFVSIDTEFTGLNDSSKSVITCFDTPESVYQKLLKPASDNIIIQFGLCLVNKIKDESYEVRPYNFYVFPRSSKIVPSTSFSCQNTSLEFLSNHGMDFNKLIKEGVSYLKASTEHSLLVSLLDDHKKQYEFKKAIHSNPHGHKLPNFPDNQKDYLNRQKEALDAFLISSDQVFSLEPCSNFIRRSLYCLLKSNYAHLLYVRNGEEAALQVVKLNGSHNWKKVMEEEQKQEIEALEQLAGFGKIIKLLQLSGKLLVGHHMLRDVMLTVQQFSCDLPGDYIGFKELLRENFPEFLDTKHVCATFFKNIGVNSTLELLSQALTKSDGVPPVSIKTTGNYFSSETSFHNAAYDAYITASCYVRMLASLKCHQKEVPLDSLKNKFYLMRITDVPYMNIAGNDLPLSRDYMFHVLLPPGKSKPDLLTFFKNFGQLYCHFLEEREAYVCLLDEKHKSRANLIKCGTSEEGFEVQPLMNHLQQASLKRKNNCGEGSLKKSKLN